jgi:ribonuclease HI
VDMVTIFFDGGSRGNPGRAGWGYAIRERRTDQQVCVRGGMTGWRAFSSCVCVLSTLTHRSAAAALTAFSCSCAWGVARCRTGPPTMRLSIQA